MIGIAHNHSNNIIIVSTVYCQINRRINLFQEEWIINNYMESRLQQECFDFSALLRLTYIQSQPTKFQLIRNRLGIKWLRRIHSMGGRNIRKIGVQIYNGIAEALYLFTHIYFIYI
ncbi:unnamed protein product [Paramecium octaurelia]|uniref:Uncharacterized protein n=1 Tax=Paramecium octaurelia TaxID=43137 RepID=A0A8S1YHW2_PAROT|nr:unnamed protein product [Paramecium octaurelia]